jgi:hypothetical protein
MPITAEDWYDPNPDLKNLYQGDVLDGVPLVFTPAKEVRWVILRPLPKGPLDDARAGLPRSFKANIDSGFPTSWDRQDGELVMAGAGVYRIMILSRSCNLDWKKNIQVAPVYPVEDVAGEDLACLRENDNAFSFYLPPDGKKMPESYADLSQIATVHVSYLRRTDHLIARLKPLATVALQDVLSEYYARPFGFDTKDDIPQAALYRCAGCFFNGVDDCPIAQIGEGGKFPLCPTCGEGAQWVKVQEHQ